MSTKPSRTLSGNALKHAVQNLAAEIYARCETNQGGIGTFSNSALLSWIERLNQLNPALPWEHSIEQMHPEHRAQFQSGLGVLQKLIHRRSQGRFVEFHDRVQADPSGLRSDTDIGHFNMTMSQGMIDCLHWKGMPLLKTVYDFSLYPMMLWQLKPRTIFELGSGGGASAVWLSDLCKLHGLETSIYSVDLKKPDIEYDNITFLAGDSRDLDSVFTPEMLGAAHPWLVLDDAHADVAGVLKFFHNYLKAGDYVLIEDSPTLLGEVGRFIEQHPRNYKVDTFYTDFFGRNATSANDSILVRL